MKWIIASVVVVGFAIPPAHSAEQPGKEAYDNTCKKCHGDNGAGDTMADRFYQITIPRLNSDYVQSKTDAEIKTIVTKGKGKMVPVRPGTPSPSHVFSGEWVDDVIAYVRTFKKKETAR